MNRQSQRMILIMFITLLSAVGLPAQPAQNVKMKMSSDCLWRDIDEAPLLASRDIQQQRQIVPDVYRTVRVDRKALKRRLARAPKEFTEAAKTIQTVITLPMPDGTFAQFLVQETQIMSPELARQASDMKTYSGHGMNDRTATLRCDWTRTGFHATVLSSGETVYVDPYRKGDTETYISYYKKDLKRDVIRRPY